MRSSLLFGFIILGLTLTAVARVINGTLLNGDDPYFIKGDDGNVYKAEWYSGSTLFFEGDEVILTGTFGLVKMIDDDSDEAADVSVEEVSEGQPRIRIPVPVPDLTPICCSFLSPSGAHNNADAFADSIDQADTQA